MKQEILIVDDQRDICEIIAEILQDQGYATRSSFSSDQVLEQLGIKKPALVILDVWLNDNRFDGIELLDVIKQHHPTLPVVMMSGHGTIQMALDAVKRGAYDFLEKPFKTDRLLSIVQKAIQEAQLRWELEDIKRNSFYHSEFIGVSSWSQQIRGLIDKAAKSNSRILIVGESGTGKESIARQIHSASARAKGPFIVVNCASLSLDDFEKQFFGVIQPQAEQGSSLIQIGFLEMADKGTLYLDGVNELPVAAQGKLLKVLHDNKFQRVQSSALTSFDVRIISSCSKNIKEALEKKVFREDLYYRLSLFVIDLLPLRSRSEDILPLVDYFNAYMASIEGKKSMRLDPDAQMALQNYAWPGNVRQLRNTVEWFFIMYGDKSEQRSIDLQDLPSDIISEHQTVMPSDDQWHALLKLPLREAREHFEKIYMGYNLRRFSGNVARTSKAIGMERTALHRKVKLLELDQEKEQQCMQ